MKRVVHKFTPSRLARVTVLATEPRRRFPAWIDAAEGEVSLSPVDATVTPRVRDGLVLRRVAKRPSKKTSKASDVRRAG